MLLEEAVIDDVCSKFGCSASDVVDAVPPPYPALNLRAGKPVDGGDLAATRAGVAVVTEARERGNMRFATSADYMRYLSAKAKTSEGKRAV